MTFIRGKDIVVFSLGALHSITQIRKALSEECLNKNKNYKRRVIRGTIEIIKLFLCNYVFDDPVKNVAVWKNMIFTTLFLTNG